MEGNRARHDEAWQYGYISGKPATLRWALGSEWDFLDTYKGRDLSSPRHADHAGRRRIIAAATAARWFACFADAQSRVSPWPSAAGSRDLPVRSDPCPPRLRLYPATTTCESHRYPAMARSADAPARRMVTHMRPEMPAAASPVTTKSRARYRVLSPPGLRIKQLVLGIGAVYFTFVAVTNVVNFIVSAGGYHWSFLNSGNVSYIASITKVYSWPSWFDKAAVLAASLVEAAGALLFWKALWNFRGHGTGVRDAWIALGWNIMVWLGFIAWRPSSSSPTSPKARSGNCWPSPCSWPSSSRSSLTMQVCQTASLRDWGRWPIRPRTPTVTRRILLALTTRPLHQDHRSLPLKNARGDRK